MAASIDQVIPEVVDTTVSETFANERFGDRYGIDWIYHDDALGYLPAKPVKALEDAIKLR